MRIQDLQKATGTKLFQPINHLIIVMKKRKKSKPSRAQELKTQDRRTPNTKPNAADYPGPWFLRRW